MRLGGCSDAGRMVLLVLALCCAPAASDGLLQGIMDTIVVKKGFLQEGIVEITKSPTYTVGEVVINKMNLTWRNLLPHYRGPFNFVVCFVLLGLLFPIAGLFWCGCYMCRRRRRRRPFDRKHDACLKGLLTILLIALLTLFLFGMVGSLVTELQLEEGLNKVCPRILRQSANVHAMLNETYVNIYPRLEKYANSTETIAHVNKSLIEFLKKNNVDPNHPRKLLQMRSIMQQLNHVQRDLREVKYLTNMLPYQAGQLNAGLRKVKRNLLRTLANCDITACINLQRKHRISELNTDIQYRQMPDVSELLNNVTALLDSHITEEVADGLRVHKDIKYFQNLQHEFCDFGVVCWPSLAWSLRVVAVRFGEIKYTARWVIDTWIAVALKAFENEVTKARELLDSYGHYRRYLGVGVAVELMLITLVLAWGLLRGVYGKRPEVYGASDCCNKASGSRCLYFGMFLIFVTGTIFCMMTIAYFVTGVLVQRLFCDPLIEPRNNTVFKTVDQYVNLERILYQHKARAISNFTLTEMLVNCHQNLTMFQVLRLPRVLDTAMRIMNRLEWQRSLQPEPAFPRTRIVLLRDSAKRMLRMLVDSGLSNFQSDRILWALETNITSLELPALAHTLERTADSVGARAGYGAVPAELRAAAGELLALHEDIVSPMLRHTAALNETVYSLCELLRFNHTSMKEAITQLLHEDINFVYEETEAYRVHKLNGEFFMKAYVSLYDKVIDQSFLGYCGPYSEAINATRDAVCRHLLLPLNWNWVSVGFCVLLMLPLLLVSARLARLYLQTDPYPGPLVEAAFKADKRYIRGEPMEQRREGVCVGGPGSCGATVAADRGAGEAGAAPQHTPRAHI